MAKGIGVICIQKRDAAIACVLDTGWVLVHPSTGKVTGFSNLGDYLEYESSEHALQQFNRGSGIQFWRESDRDLFISSFPENGVIRVYFDGHTDEEMQAILASFQRHSIDVSVEYEDA